MNRTYPTDQPNTDSFPLSPTARLGIGVLMIAAVLMLVAFVIREQTPPAAVSADAPANVFSSGRAMKHLQVIAQTPRPIGSAAHAAARDYILKALTTMGLQPEVQEASVVTTRPDGSVVAAVVRNVVARLNGASEARGTSENKALLLAGHYDTVPNALGASDDGSAVATMLETLRALKAGSPLNNDVIFLFTDGEELGLFGAKAFVNEHPWAKDVGLVLNFEARGIGGPVLMFETSDGNGWLVRELAQAAPSPVTNSLLYEIYKLLPNDSDLSVFKGRRIPGLNFAYLDGAMYYHTQADNIENLDQRSLQHQGSYALALAQHFGNAKLDQTPGQNAVYFDLLGTTLLHYSARWVLPLSILILIVFIAVFIIGLKRRKLTIAGVVVGFVLFVLNLIVASATVYLGWRVIGTIQIRMGRILTDDFYREKIYLVGFVLLAIAITVSLYNLFRRKVSTENLFAGALLCWVILLLLTSIAMPGGSYLLAWPLLIMLLGVGYIFVTEAKSRAALNLVVLFVCAVPAIVLFVPIIYTAFVALGLNEVSLLIPLVILLCGLLIPHFAFVTSTGRWWLPVATLLAALICVAVAAFNSGYSRRYPSSDHVLYVQNADTGKAAWASADDSTDEWTTQFFPSNTPKTSLKEFVPLSVNEYRINSAPAIPLSVADVRVTNDGTMGDVHILRLRITAAHEGISIAVPRDANVEVVGAEINGKRVGETRNARGQSPTAWSLQFWAPPKEGFDLTLELKGARPLPLKIVEQSYGLPEIPGTTIRPRPDYIVPSMFSNSNFSLVTKSYEF